ncbi:hypothetical protein M0811_13926 [Anaeramoeba ignava]|uniref:Uncharacterized protein n=1 Tax=Anaeramoeba ignava TaxID=1746090 RepID=A0A9Q0LZB7_ANAIG|nr:hypothetical protein M0811_13926 [Anaeramoeba ignava]
MEEKRKKTKITKRSLFKEKQGIKLNVKNSILNEQIFLNYTFPFKFFSPNSQIQKTPFCFNISFILNSLGYYYSKQFLVQDSDLSFAFDFFFATVYYRSNCLDQKTIFQFRLGILRSYLWHKNSKKKFLKWKELVNF